MIKTSAAQLGDNNRIRKLGEYSDSPIRVGERDEFDGLRKIGGKFAREIEDRQIGGTEQKTGGRHEIEDSPLKAMFRRVADRVLGAGKSILATVTKPEVHRESDFRAPIKTSRIRVSAPQFAMGAGGQ